MRFHSETFEKKIWLKRWKLWCFLGHSWEFLESLPDTGIWVQDWVQIKIFLWVKSHDKIFQVEFTENLTTSVHCKIAKLCHKIVHWECCFEEKREVHSCKFWEIREQIQSQMSKPWTLLLIFDKSDLCSCRFSSKQHFQWMILSPSFTILQWTEVVKFSVNSTWKILSWVLTHTKIEILNSSLSSSQLKSAFSFLVV